MHPNHAKARTSARQHNVPDLAGVEKSDTILRTPGLGAGFAVDDPALQTPEKQGVDLCAAWNLSPRFLTQVRSSDSDVPTLPGSSGRVSSGSGAGRSRMAGSKLEGLDGCVTARRN